MIIRLMMIIIIIIMIIIVPFSDHRPLWGTAMSYSAPPPSAVTRAARSGATAHEGIPYYGRTSIRKSLTIRGNPLLSKEIPYTRAARPGATGSRTAARLTRGSSTPRRRCRARPGARPSRLPAMATGRMFLCVPARHTWAHSTQGCVCCSYGLQQGG